jgi:ABC-2 type transport system ATP-binding protein
LGPNGAGKSTTMKMLSGFLAPTSGSAAVAGFDVQSAGLMARRRLGYLPEGAPLYPEMTVRGLLKFVGEARGLGGDKTAAIARVLGQLALEPVADQMIDTLSKGFRRRVGLAQAILHQPDALILDEPTDGLDPNQKAAVRGLIRSLQADKGVIISTHILEEVEAVCTRAVIIDRGRIVADGAPADLRARSAYAHAVTMTFAPGTSLLALRAPGKTEQSVLPDGRIRLTVLSPNRSPILPYVAEAVTKIGLDPIDVTVEAGRLDDVFQELTTPDAPDALAASPKATS